MKNKDELQIIDGSEQFRTKVSRQLFIDEKLLQTAKDFIPNIVQFKLSSIQNGQQTALVEPIIEPTQQKGFDDKKLYIPPKLKILMQKLDCLDLNEAIQRDIGGRTAQSLNQINNEESDGENIDDQDYKLNNQNEKAMKKNMQQDDQNDYIKPLTKWDLSQQKPISSIFNKSSGWESDSEEEKDQPQNPQSFGQPRVLDNTQLKRMQLEKQQRKQFPDNKKRKRDEWDIAYDSGKQKKMRAKVYKPFELQNRQFQQTYEEFRENKKHGIGPNQNFKKRNDKFTQKKNVKIY